MTREELRRARELDAQLPEVVDLVVLAIRSGLTVPAALRAVAPQVSGRAGVALRIVVARVDAGARLTTELANVPSLLGDAFRPLTTALLAAHVDGAPIAATLERLAVDARRSSRLAAQERARRVPVLLLFPLVLCVLPAFVLLTVAPLLVDSLTSLRTAP